MESIARWAALSLLTISLGFMTACASGRPGSGPGLSAWRAFAEPEAAGWSGEGLERARRIAEENRAGSVLVIEDGRVVVAWGEIDRPLPLYSMRKGIYNALVGMLVDEGRIDPRSTLAELGIDDLRGLTESERSATVADVLASRSAIYHASAYEPASMKRGRPERGAHAPGEEFFYNNWDFNLVAHLIEKASGTDMPELFRTRLAEPLGMEDWSRSDVFEFFEPSRSRYPAPIFRLSARDLARVGQLYLQKGRWDGARLLSESWIEESWTPRTIFQPGDDFPEGAGFGYLWWIHPRRPRPSSQFEAHDIYLTRGSDGQVLAVIPALEVVIVHQTDSENGFESSFEGAVGLIDALLAARGSAPEKSRVRTAAVEPVPFDYARLAPPRVEAVRWTEESREALVGTYALGPGITFRVHAIGERLFALPKGIPLAEVELFSTAGGEIFSPAVAVRLAPVLSEDGRVRALEGFVDGNAVRLERVE